LPVDKDFEMLFEDLSESVWTLGLSGMEMFGFCDLALGFENDE